LRASSNTGPLAAFVVMALIWGYNWVVMKVALQYSGPLAFSAWRCALGVLLLFGVLLALRVPLKPRELGKTIWLGLFQIFAFVALVAWALSSGAAGKSAVLAYTMPFWVIMFGWPLAEARPRGWQWLALALAFVGLLLVLELWRGQASLVSSALALAAGAAWAVGTLIFKRIPVRTHDELLSLTAWQMLFGAIPLVVLALLVHERPIEWNAALLAALGFNAVGAMAIATLLWLYILYRLPTTISSLSSLIVPIGGVLAAWLQLGERPSAAEGAGMVLILVALGLLIAPQRVAQPITGD
jgi:drug/metabolite transporter (DMT)-like permease